MTQTPWPGIGVDSDRVHVAAVAAQFVTAALVVATGTIHFYLYHHYFSTVPTIGRLFLLNFVTSLVLGGVILVFRAPWWSLIGAGFCLATLGAFLVSVHWGLFGYQETLNGAWQQRAAAVEIAGTAVGVTAAILARRLQRRATSRR